MVAVATLLALLAAASQSSAAPGSVSASFAVEPSSPLSLQPVTFRSTSTSTATKVTIAAQSWDLDGDGAFEVANAPLVTRSFPRSGAYPVRLRVTDSRGRQFDAATSVHVGNRPPVAAIAQVPQAPVTNDQVTFFSTSTDPDGSIASYGWDLDADGAYDDGAGALAARSFNVPGAYPVALSVVDDQGAFGVASTIVSVGAPPGAVALGSPSRERARPSLLSPFPIVRISGIIVPSGIKLRLLSVEAPTAARVQVDCRGRGCPFQRRRVTVSADSRATRTLRFRQFGKRVLRVRSRLEIRVSSRRAIGKYTRFRVLRGSPPSRLDRCLPPGKRRPVACPTG